jgi:IS5 family transposase
MRTTFHENILDPNMQFGVTPISSLRFDVNCRSATVKVLRALQHVYTNRGLCEQVLGLVEQAINPEEGTSDRGRRGMDYWQILVLASVRLGCDLTYDELHDLAYQHEALKVMLGVGGWDEISDDEPLTYRRIRDNVCLLPVETIRAIDQLIVQEGHRIVPGAGEIVRGDSFVVGTNIHYPSESRLLMDGVRKIIECCVELSKVHHLPGWRKHEDWIKKSRGALKAVTMAARSRGRGHKEKLRKAYKGLFSIVECVLEKALQTHEAWLLLQALKQDLAVCGAASDLVYYLSATEHIRQVSVRRIMEEEIVPRTEKIFSIFEPHTELINRGKHPQPIEFGHRVLVIEDAAGFICHHDVIDIGLLDQHVLVEAMESLQKRLGGKVRSASFDCGFYTPVNHEALEKIVASPCLPAKGSHKAKKQREQASVQWHEARAYHAGVESAIHALQSGNGLDRCRDHTRMGYDRYISLGVLGRNLLTLGRLLIAQEDPLAPAAHSERKAVNF